MRIRRPALRSIASLLTVLALLFYLGANLFGGAYAGAISSRKVTISNSAGAATPVEHDYSFDPESVSTIGEIRFLYCTAATGSCTAPTGLSVTSFTLDAENLTGVWAKDAVNTTVNMAVIDIVTPEAPPVGAVTVDLGAITNPTANDTTYYVRITTYTTNAGSVVVDGPAGVAFATVSAVTVSATVAEILTFAVGSTTVNLGTLTTGAVSNQTLTSTVTTNAQGGYISTIKDDKTGTVGLASNGNNIDDTAGGTIVAGEEEYGVATSKASQTITQDTDCPTTPYNASAATNSPQSYASASGPISSDIATLCFAASVTALTPTGSYSNTTTLITTATF